MEKKEVFIKIPSSDVYYGVRVDESTKLEYKNDIVEQKLENLILHTKYVVKTDRFTSKIDQELYLKEGEILLLEESERGYFVPEVRFGTMEEVDKEIDFLKEQISKIKE